MLLIGDLQLEHELFEGKRHETEVRFDSDRDRVGSLNRGAEV
jgi:hypothetical protein